MVGRALLSVAGQVRDTVETVEAWWNRRREGTIRGMGEEWEFDAELWAADATDPWVFVTVPPEVDERLRLLPRQAGFGSVRVEVTVGGSTWRTSVFPDRARGHVLPVRRAVRRAESLDVGDLVRIRLRLADT